MAEMTPEDTTPIFSRLPSGRGRLSPEDVARNQKARLQGAMVEAVARHGYPDTTLGELVSLAGVSKTTFYDHFENKEECFLSTFDEIVKELARRVTAAYRQPGDFREKLLAATGVFLATAEEEPAAARLAAVDSLTLGAAGVAHRERASAAFEALIQQSFQHSPEARPMPATTVRAVVGGIRGVTYRKLRAGDHADLPAMNEELVDWALGYQKADGEAVERAMRSAAKALPHLAGQEEAVPWGEPPDSQTSRASLSQRERMIRGTAMVVVEHGYGALSIPAISGAAGVSNQTFYEHFASKREAFLAAFEQIAARALTLTEEAIATASDPLEALGAGVRSLLDHVAENELFARLAFFELPTAGPIAMDRADAILDHFTGLIQLGAGATGGGIDSATIREAIGSGIWAVVQHEIFHGRRAELPQLAPEITRLALAPLTA
jgi:AcrR family transcriptional regulator